MTKKLKPEDRNILRKLLDPTTFLQHFVKIDTTEGIKPWRMDPYQKRFVRDMSRNRVINKSKKVGISTTIAGEALHRSYIMPGRQIVFVATGQRIAGELLGKFYDEYDSLPPALKVPLKKRSMEVAQFRNNARVWSLPSADPGTIRGLGMRGTATDVYVDEYAHVPNDRELWVVVHDFQILGGRVTLNSTPKGKRGKYYEIAEPLQAVYEQEKRIPKSEWSYHQINFRECPRLVHQEEKLRTSMTDVDFSQEYDNRFLDESVSFFPYELIWKNQKISELVCLSPQSGKPVRFGIDFGKKISETVIYVTEEYAEEHFRTLWIEVLPGVDYPTQVEVIKQLDKIFNPVEIHIDASGPGGQAVYDFLTKEADEFAYRIVPHDFTSSFKEKIIIRTRILLQGKRLDLPDKTTTYGEKLEIQLHSITRETTKTGLHTRYSGKEYGLDDMVWALALSIYKEHTRKQEAPMLELVQDRALQKLDKIRKRRKLRVIKEWQI